MQQLEDEIIQRSAKQCKHCLRNTLRPYEYEFTCISFGYNAIKRKNELSKISREKMNFINRLIYAELKKNCICIDFYKIYEGGVFDETYEALSKLKNKKLKINNILMEKYTCMNENADFEQNQYSRTAEGIYKIGHDSIRLMKWSAFYGRCYYQIINYYNLMGSILTCLNEIP